MTSFSWEVLKRAPASRARLGRLTTPHGEIHTPAFMPVGTYGVVKGLPPHLLKNLPVEIMLVNALHLSLRPGLESIASHGTIHDFMGWDRPILADSGGYQVYSLKDKVTIRREGCTFRDPLSGDPHFLGPKEVVHIQESLGVDIGMILDVCPSPDDPPEKQRQALDLTIAWAGESADAWNREGPTALFGITQGWDPESRKACIRELLPLDFAGYAIGGLGLGETKETTWSLVDACTRDLPEEKPRYLMGMGYPEDIRKAVERGVDLFDCVLPTRNARNGQLFTRKGVINFKKRSYLTVDRPPDEDCACPTCTTTSLGYLCHLFRIKDMGASILATIHNLWFYLDFMEEIRHNIVLS